MNDEQNVEDYYQPPKRNSDFSLKRGRATEHVGLNRKAIMSVSAIFALLVMLIVMQAFSNSPKAPETENKKQYGTHKTEALNDLPSSYKELADRNRKHTPQVTNVNHTVVEKRKISAEEKIWQDYQVKKIKRAIEARESNLSVRSLKQNPLIIDSRDRKTNFKTSNSATDSDFFKQKHFEATHINAKLQEPASPYELFAGTIVPGVMITGINSDLPGQIIGQISQNVFDSKEGAYLLLPQGTKIIGEYDSEVSYGQERVLVVWTRLILPNGKSILLERMQGVDLSGYAGLSDQVNNHYGKLLSGVVFGSMFGASAQIAQGGNRTVNPSFGQLAVEGAAQNINQVGQQLTRKNLNIQPTLEIRPGMRFNVFLTKDVTLEVYEG